MNQPIPAKPAPVVPYPANRWWERPRNPRPMDDYNTY